MDVTYNFIGGTKAVANQVNTNFQDVKTAVDVLETDVASLQGQLGDFILPDGSRDFTRLQSYKTNSINNATNATPIVITATAHGYITGDKVCISGVEGNTAANGTWTITRITDNTFSLDTSAGNGAYTSGGTAIIYPVADDNLSSKQYVDKSINAKALNFGTSTTASATAAKVATCTGFTLSKGAIVEIVFSNANTVAGALTLNVEGTGAKAIYNEAGTAVSATNPAYFPAGSTVEFTYNGTNWIFKKRCIENYINGTSWYRVYSDGWIEQGGIYSGGQADATITLIKNFSNTSYSLVLSAISQYVEVISARCFGEYAPFNNVLSTRTVSTFRNFGGDTVSKSWRAEGY